jgi:hypothetical protein
MINIIMKNSYVYAYLREDGSPYYIGKGVGKRYKDQHNVVVPPENRIQFIKEQLTDDEAVALEIELIARYGRKDLGTGILRNLTDGGEGMLNPSPSVRKKLSNAKLGKKPNNYGKKYKSGPSVAKSLSKKGNKHPQYGKERTEEERAKIAKGIKESWSRPTLTCPHCGKQGKVGMTRWHFANCKLLTK